MRICPQCGTRFQEPTQFCPHDGSQTYEAQENRETPKDPMLGRVVDGRYRIEQQIGEGGMGVVYLATHTVLQKRLALKVLRGDNSREAEVVQRFMQEAQAATSIGHPNIIDISDFGRLPDGAVYFVMEYLNGTSLNDMIKRGGSVPTTDSIHIIRQIASALEAAHARGIVHRDLKPDNIFVIKQGTDPLFVKVLDFGVAKVGGAASKLTKTGMVFGTPHYMSPEQAAGQSVDQRTDVYALGVIMYEMFTGKVPFDADTFMGILSKHMFEAPTRPSEINGAPLGPLEAVLLKALEKGPDHRYQSMGELLTDLDTIAAGGAVASSQRQIAPPPGNLKNALEPPHATAAVAHGAPSASSTSGSKMALAALAAVALVVVAGGVGLAVFLASGSATEEVARAQPIESEPRDPAPSPNGTITTAPAPAPIPRVAPNPPVAAPVAAADEALVHITSDPEGAEVLLDGVMVGNTPVDVPRPESGTQLVVLRLRDHQETTLQIGPQSGPSMSVTLERPRRVASATRFPRQPSAQPSQPTIMHQPAPSPPPVVAAPQPRRTHSSSEVVDPWAQ